NAEPVLGEGLGASEGVPGQRFAVQRRPVVPGDPLVLEVSEGEGWGEWQAVPDFGGSQPDDRHFVFDPVAGEVQLGPAVRLEAAPEVARVRCLPAGDGVEAGAVRVLVVPAVTASGGRVSFEQLAPDEETVRKIAERLDRCRLIGARVMVQPALYRGVTVVARL